MSPEHRIGVPSTSDECPQSIGSVSPEHRIGVPPEYRIAVAGISGKYLRNIGSTGPGTPCTDGQFVPGTSDSHGFRPLRSALSSGLNIVRNGYRSRLAGLPDLLPGATTPDGHFVPGASDSPPRKGQHTRNHSSESFPVYTEEQSVQIVSRSRPPMSCAHTRQQGGSPGSRPSCIFAAVWSVHSRVPIHPPGSSVRHGG